LAGDGTKLRAQNSKKNNYNPRKVERHLQMIDNKLGEYAAALSEADGDSEKQNEIKKQIKKQKQQKKRYQQLQQEMDTTGTEQVSTSDPDSRHLIIRGQVTEVAYNIQSTVDAKNNLPIDYLVTNQNDTKAMGNMLQRATDIVGHNKFTALYDKGYHTGSEFEKAEKLGVKVLVAEPQVSSHAPDTRFDVEHFRYHPKKDCYTCRAGKTLSTNGHIYNKAHGKTQTTVKHYKTSACAVCALSSLCTRNPKGRVIERPQFAELVEKNRRLLKRNPELYRKRQAIVEHPFGTIKRAWGFDHIMTKKTMRHASADVGLIFTAYNLMRLMHLLGVGFAGLFKAVFGGILRRYKGIWGLLAAFCAPIANHANIFNEGIEGLEIGLILVDGRGYGTNCRWLQA
jgi:hypothetical protein